MTRIHGYVYLIRCLVDGKVYIGCTTHTPEKRFKAHCGSANRIIRSNLAKAIERYGQAAFEVFTLSTHTDRRSMLVAEYNEIVRHRATDPSVGFNRNVYRPHPLGERAETEGTTQVVKPLVEAPVDLVSLCVYQQQRAA